VSQKNHEFKKGDWIVHITHGLSQIKKKETKSIGGQNKQYFRAQASDGEFWIPMNDIDPTRIRPVSSKYMMRKALKVLKSKPIVLEEDKKEREKQIIELMSDGSLITDAELLRTFAHQKVESGLSKKEKDYFERIKDRFLHEWTICMEIDFEQAEQKLDSLLGPLTP
jgi:RNA polymerase-interacting CarD/CdnL/TRCF family regulator